MFRIAEEYTKTIKTNPKIDFQIFDFFEIFKNQNFEKKSEISFSIGTSFKIDFSF